MIHLIIVSLIWAFSFGLIKDNLSTLDSNFVACARMAIAGIVFLPFLKIKKLPGTINLLLVLVGMIQYGIMYITYIYAFKLLAAYQVALFTIFTPLYVTLINDLLTRKLHPLFLTTTLFAIFGTAIITYDHLSEYQLRLGFAVMQISNLCFALGQVAYKRIMVKQPNTKNYNIFGLMYIGAFLITLASAAATGGFKSIKIITLNQTLTLIYLGAIASGLCFFLWNFGATKTDVGALAICNNLKMPLAITVSLLFFEAPEVNIPKLIIGTAIIIASLATNELFQHRKKLNKPEET